MARPIWLVDPTKVTHLQSGQVYNKPATGNWNGLALAMKLAEPFDTIGLRGTHAAPSICVGSPHSVNTVKLPNNEPVHDLHVYGLTPDAVITGGVSFGAQYGLPYNLHFSDYTHKCTSQSAFIANMNSGPYLGMKITDVLMDTSALTSTGKPVNKWVFRFHGYTQFHIENVTQTHQNGEHFVYSDNVQGDSVIRGCTAYRNGRTFIQIVNRGDSGPSGYGHIVIENSTAVESGYTEGASAYTIAGHAGTVSVLGCKAINTKGGALVAWAPSNHNDYRNAEGKSVDHLIIDNCDFQSSTGDRDAIAISSCSIAEIGICKIHYNKNAIHLEHQQGHANTLFKFTQPNPSQQDWVAPKKVTKGWNKLQLEVLTDPQIDALYVPGFVDDNS